MKILFVTSTRIGDAILSTGLLDHLIREHPGAQVTVACGAPAAPLFAAVPGLERLVVVRKKPLHSHWLSLWAGCVGTHWDIVVDLRGSALARVLLARKRIVMKYRDDDIHRVTELGKMVGIDPPPDPRVWITDSYRTDAATLMPEGPPVLVVGPTANWGGKCWPAERFAALADRATGPDGFMPGGRIAVIGAESEREMAAPVLDIGPPDRMIDLVGTSLPEAAACLERAALYVGNDSGLMHLSAAVGTPTLGLFGPSLDRRYYPWGKNCKALRTPESHLELVTAPDFDHRSQRSLMTGLGVDAVYEALAELYINVKNTSEDNR